MKLLIAGGTGFVGKALIAHLLVCDYEVHVLTRNKEKSGASGKSHSEETNGVKTANLRYFNWDINKGFIEDGAFEGISAIINLTGANIGEKRWTAKRKAQIIESRVKSIELLFQYTQKLEVKARQNIKTLISSSAVGYYGAITSDKIFTEDDASGNDFLAAVCIAWENAAHKFKDLGINTIILRKGVVIGEGGGMYKKLAPQAKLGINVSLGSGKQYLPWIDLRDLVRIYSFILDSNLNADSELNADLELNAGPELKDGSSVIYNAVSTKHLTMNQFSERLLSSFGKKSFLPNAPAFIIKLLFGEMSVMLLKGSRVSSQKLVEAGFKFDY